MLKRASAGGGEDQADSVNGDCVARARELAPLIEVASARIEAAREIPQDLLTALHAARIFRMLIPRSCGGDEATPTAFFEAIESIAKADASTAWCLGQGCVVSMAAAYLKPEVAQTFSAIGAPSWLRGLPARPPRRSWSMAAIA